MPKRFEATYTVADGYANQSGRPHAFHIDEGMLADNMDDNDLYDLLNDLVQEDFAQSMTPEPSNEVEFVEWAQGIICSREPND